MAPRAQRGVSLGVLPTPTHGLLFSMTLRRDISFLLRGLSSGRLHHGRRLRTARGRERVRKASGLLVPTRGSHIPPFHQFLLVRKQHQACSTPRKEEVGKNMSTAGRDGGGICGVCLAQSAPWDWSFVLFTTQCPVPTWPLGTEQTHKDSCDG